jgi:hypothetical protein
MEDSNEIGYSEVGRIEELETIIRRHKFAVSGGAVLGGFGKLPKNQSELPLEQRLANIKAARAKYELVGENISIAGSFEDGFKFS